MPSIVFDSAAGTRVCFLGRGACEAAETPGNIDLGLLGRCPPDEICWNRQIHGDRTVVAEPESVVDADALMTSRRGLCLAVYVADCVPVLLASPRSIAAVHAGWRGLAKGIVEKVASRLGAGAEPLTAWIGPSMAGCCYEVSERVAHAVAVASTASVVKATPKLPHLDLPSAAAAQLRRTGVEEIRWFAHCTGCSPDRWWSHRRSSKRALRNYALIWRPGSRDRC